MVSEEDFSHLEVQHFQSRPIYVLAPFYPANANCATLFIAYMNISLILNILVDAWTLS